MSTGQLVALIVSLVALPVLLIVILACQQHDKAPQNRYGTVLAYSYAYTRAAEDDIRGTAPREPQSREMSALVEYAGSIEGAYLTAFPQKEYQCIEHQE